MNKTDLIQKLKTLEGLTAAEKADLINLVNTNKKYGLVWEDKPEEVEEQLRQHLPVLQEVVVKRILATIPPPVEAAANPSNAIPFPEDEANQSPSQNQTNNSAPPNHILIEGDNLHALTALSFTHEGKIDVIYIDPPYNTGNKDFKYNDSFVDKEDSYRHSKWLSFMDKRLRIAKKLLSEKGVVFISIDENESHNLRLLLDAIFGETNFIEQLVWNKRIPKNDKGIGNVHEYIYLYAKGYTSEHLFTQRKEGIEDVNELVAWLAKKKVPIIDAEKEVKRFYKKNDFDRGITLYNSLDENYQLWGKINVSWPNAKTIGPRYDVLHPKTLKPAKVPDRGWRFTKDTFDSMLDYDNVIEHHDGSFICGKIWFAKDEDTQPSTIKYLNEVNEFLLRSIISTKSDGGNELIDILGTGKFDYPKPVDLIDRLINSTNGKSLTILDFFAGSGTTLHATMQLNAEDGGSRQCILVTNNENNICEEVTYERNKRVIQGYTNAKGLKVEGLTNNNLRYYKSLFVPASKSEANKRLLTNTSTDLLCIKEDCYDDITEAQGFSSKQCRIYTNTTGHYLLVIYHSRQLAETCEALIAWIQALPPTPTPIKLYAFSPEKDTLAEDFAEVAHLIEAVPLPEAIYNAYRATFKTLKIDRQLITPEQVAANKEPELFDNPEQA